MFSICIFHLLLRCLCSWHFQNSFLLDVQWGLNNQYFVWMNVMCLTSKIFYDVSYFSFSMEITQFSCCWKYWSLCLEIGKKKEKFFANLQICAQRKPTTVEDRCFRKIYIHFFFICERFQMYLFKHGFFQRTPAYLIGCCIHIISRIPHRWKCHRFAFEAPVW